MKNRLVLFIFIFASTLTSALCSAKPKPANNTPQLQKNIDNVIANFGENLNIGILVEDAETGKILYQKNPDRYFAPASNEKLFTAFGALHSLGADYVYRTSLYADKTKIKDGILNDNIGLIFSGDPTLTMEQLDTLVAALVTAGIHEIRGNIMIDDTAFDNVFISPGTVWDDSKFCYDAPISAIIIDHNCISATLVPAQTAGLAATLNLPGKPQFIHLNNTVITADTEQKDCSPELELTDDFTYTLSGCVKAADKPIELKMAVKSPRIYLQSTLLYLLNKYHIKANPTFYYQPFLSENLLASTSSLPAGKLVTTMLKESDNTIANVLFKTIGARAANTAGTWKNGHHALHESVNQILKFDMPRATLIDGAGGSRYDYLTPQQIVALLRNEFKENDIAFVSGLPIAGVDGTLKERMQAPDIAGKILAKTGTSSAITSLSGYANTKRNQTLIFSIMINGFVAAPAKYQVLEDQICNAMING